MKHYKLIIFDWDGTLIDSLPLVVSCVKSTARAYNCKEPTTEQIMSLLGTNTGEYLLQQLFPHLDKNQVLTTYKYYFSHGNEAERPFPGVIATLKVLKQKNLILAIATNKSRRDLERSLELHNIATMFSTSRTPDDGYLKPQPEMVWGIVAEVHVSPQETLIVGDSIYDMQLAKNAQIDSIAVSYGLHNEQELQKYLPIKCIDKFEQLLMCGL